MVATDACLMQGGLGLMSPPKKNTMKGQILTKRIQKMIRSVVLRRASSKKKDLLF